MLEKVKNLKQDKKSAHANVLLKKIQIKKEIEMILNNPFYDSKLIGKAREIQNASFFN